MAEERHTFGQVREPAGLRTNCEILELNPIDIGNILRRLGLFTTRRSSGMVRKLTRTVLETSGYFVLEAKDGREGLSVCESHQGTIDFLMSDVVMPEMGGRELAERARMTRPDLNVLFTSGYTQAVILKEGIKKGTAFLQKPYLPTELAHRIREALDAKPPSQPR